MTEQVTIFPAEYYPIYKAYKTIGGWVVNYLSDPYTSRSVDGGKLHNSRQHAYAKAERLNHPVKHALKRYGMAECYFDGNTAIVRKDENNETYETEYVLTIQEGAMPPFYTKASTSLDEIEEEVRNSKFGGRAWNAIKPEEI